MTDITSPESTGLRLQQKLNASPEEVFDALTDPEKQRLWLSALGPVEGAVETTVDLRVGGAWEARFRPNPDTEVHDVQTFVEIDRPRRLVSDLVSESTMGGRPMPTLSTHIVLELEPTPDGTRVTVEQTGFSSPDMRDFFADVAWPTGLARLEGLVRATRAG